MRHVLTGRLREKGHKGGLWEGRENKKGWQFKEEENNLISTFN